MYKFSGSSSAHETDSKAIECPTCNRPFVSTSIVNDYMHKKNKYTKSYKCEVCLKFFFTKSSLTMHGRKAVRVRHLRQKVCHQKRPAEPRGDPQRGEEVQVRGLSQGKRRTTWAGTWCTMATRSTRAWSATKSFTLQAHWGCTKKETIVDIEGLMCF